MRRRVDIFIHRDGICKPFLTGSSLSNTSKVKSFGHTVGTSVNLHEHMNIILKDTSTLVYHHVARKTYILTFC